MELTTITIRKDTAKKIKEIAKEQNRSVSAQIDYIVRRYIEEQGHNS